MLQHHQLREAEVGPSVCCVARYGSGGFANVPVGRMTELGIPVFTTPAANANAVKELVICALLLASRGVIEGHRHLQETIYKEEGVSERKGAASMSPAFSLTRHTHPHNPPPLLRAQHDFDRVSSRIEADHDLFKGQEIEGRTLGVIGLGNIGSRVAAAALALGMKVVGFDPWITVDNVWKLPGDRMTCMESLDELLKVGGMAWSQGCQGRGTGGWLSKRVRPHTYSLSLSLSHTHTRTHTHVLPLPPRRSLTTSRATCTTSTGRRITFSTRPTCRCASPTCT
jgi:D-3-phosphoglycerate dehydrogenase